MTARKTPTTSKFLNQTGADAFFAQVGAAFISNRETFLTSDPKSVSVDSEWHRLISLIRGEINRGDLPSKDVEDLTQQVLVELIELRRPPECLRGLAVRITRWRLFDWLRRAVLETCFEPLTVQHDEHPSPRADSDLAIDLSEAKRLMEDDTRGVFEAVFVRGLELRKAAEELRLTLHRVRMLCREARCFLRRLGLDEAV